MATAIKRAIKKTISKQIIYSQIRLKTYLVGIDGSDYGYSALQTAANMITTEDSLISIYFPPNIALYTQGTAGATGAALEDIEERQKKSNDEIDKHCKEIVELYGHQHINYSSQIGHVTFSAKDDLIQACYDNNADVLILGAKGLSHSLKEKLSEKLNRTGSTADYCVHHAPCDVMIVKQQHDNILPK